jgi:hypothetical protein
MPAASRAAFVRHSSASWNPALALHCGASELDYSPHPRLAFQAIRFANVRFGILPSQSSFRWNDGKETA